MMIDKTNIRELLNLYEEAIDWLIENPLAPVLEYEIVANQRAILSVKISNYYRKNRNL